MCWNEFNVLGDFIMNSKALQTLHDKLVMHIDRLSDIHVGHVISDEDIASVNFAILELKSQLQMVIDIDGE